MAQFEGLQVWGGLSFGSLIGVLCRSWRSSAARALIISRGRTSGGTGRGRSKILIESVGHVPPYQSARWQQGTNLVFGSIESALEKMSTSDLYSDAFGADIYR